MMNFTFKQIKPSPFTVRSFASQFMDSSSPVLRKKLSNSNTHPMPIRSEFLAKNKLTTQDLEAIDMGPVIHHKPLNMADKFAYRTVKTMRFFADAFFRKKYVHRSVLLETVAGVPGMVAAMLRHLTSLRRFRHDGGWIHQLLHEAENERMHLMTWMEVSKPKIFERMLVVVVQGVFFNVYFLLYVFSPYTAHRIVGYLEEEAVVSYTQFLREIDEGRIKNGNAPEIAKRYWNLDEKAKLRDVVLAVRADEANHRDVNHELAGRIKAKDEDLRNK